MLIACIIENITRTFKSVLVLTVFLLAFKMIEKWKIDSNLIVANQLIQNCKKRNILYSPLGPDTKLHMRGIEICPCCFCVDKMIFLGMNQFFCNLLWRTDDTRWFHQKTPPSNHHNIAFLINQYEIGVYFFSKISNHFIFIHVQFHDFFSIENFMKCFKVESFK